MKIINWIQLFLLVGLILFGVMVAIYNKSNLTECNQDGQAVIINKDKRKNRGYFIKYKYEVKGITYTTSESLNNEMEMKVFIGDTIDIIISCSDNNVSRYKNIDLYKNGNIQ